VQVNLILPNVIPNHLGYMSKHV